MPLVITSGCIDIMDRACVDECPVDCIYEGARKLYINPSECIDCGACEPACPQEAIVQDWQADDGQQAFLADAYRFFGEPLVGRDRPVGNPGGAARSGVIGADTPMVDQWSTSSNGSTSAA